MAKCISRFKVALNRCYNITKIEAKFLFEENLWAEVAVQTMNSQHSSLKNSQAAAQRAGNILKHSGMFEHTKMKSKKEKKPFSTLLKKVYLSLKPADSLVTIRGVGSRAPMVLGQAKVKKKICSCYIYGK